MEGYQWGGEGGRVGGKGTGNKNHNARYKIVREVKNSMGNGEAKELMCTTHGDEPRWGNAGGRGVQGRGE